MRYYFTFLGDDMEYCHRVQPIEADDYSQAREIMFKKYGSHWAFQYTEEQWNKWCKERPFYYPVETELSLLTKEDL